MNPNTKSWRKSRSGKIWATTPITMFDTTEDEIGTPICCGMCGTTASTGFLLRKEDPWDGYDWSSFDPKLALLGLESCHVKSSDAALHYAYKRQNGNWFLGECCRQTFQKNCNDLGFKLLHRRKRRR